MVYIYLSAAYYHLSLDVTKENNNIEYDVIFNTNKSMPVAFRKYSKIEGSVVFDRTVLVVCTKSYEIIRGMSYCLFISKKYILKCEHTFIS